MSDVLNEDEAAAYCRLSVNSFRKAVKAGKLPKPPDIGVRRRIWHKEALDRALGANRPGPVVEGPDDWNERKAAWKRRREARHEDRPRQAR